MRYSSILSLAFILGLFACDKVATPLKSAGATSSLPATKPTFITGDSATMNIRKILLEDCTGHFCGNCPGAAATAQTILQGTHGSQVVMVQDNMGFFAEPAGTKGGPGLPPGAPPGSYAADYRCPADSAWDNFFNISNLGLPQGMVSRVHFTVGNPSNGNVATAPGAWANLVDSLAVLPQQASIKIVDSCWVPEHVIGTAITVKFLTTLSGSYMMEAVIMEDSIADWQLDYSASPSNVPNFIHRNVLRAAYNNNSWGYTIPTSSAGDTFTKYLTYDLNKLPVLNQPSEHFYAVVFVYNATTYFVIQADMVKIE